MKEWKIFSAAGAVALFAILAVTLAPALAGAYETLSSQKNMVTVKATPAKLASGQPARFKISMSTHSVELDDDMSRASTLLDDRGREFQPEKWDGSPPGGHHRAGDLFFPALDEDVRSVRLILKGVADVPERVFEWKVKR